MIQGHLTDISGLLPEFRDGRKLNDETSSAGSIDTVHPLRQDSQTSHERDFQDFGNFFHCLIELKKKVDKHERRLKSLPDRNEIKNAFNDYRNQTKQYITKKIGEESKKNSDRIAQLIRVAGTREAASPGTLDTHRKVTCLNRFCNW